MYSIVQNNNNSIVQNNKRLNGKGYSKEKGFDLAWFGFIA
ncbi:unknow (plasmid) [Vibrio campbellii]|nr:unknow [Vibrio campbellii]